MIRVVPLRAETRVKYMHRRSPAEIVPTRRRMGHAVWSGNQRCIAAVESVSAPRTAQVERSGSSGPGFSMSRLLDWKLGGLS